MKNMKNNDEKRDVMIQINEKENGDFLPLNTLMPQGNFEDENSWDKELILPIFISFLLNFC